jgi:membrane fusion protein (multidrug efflux system)
MSEQAPPEPRRAHPLRLAVIGIVLLAGAAGGTLYWLHAQRFESTDDAFIDGNIVQLAPQVAGLVAELRIDDNQVVRKGDLLLAIDPRDFEAQVAAAKAALDMAMAQREAAAASLALIKVSSGASLNEATSAVEQAGHAVEVSKAQVAANRAAAARAAADLARDEELIRAGNVSRQRLDQSRADAQTTRAQMLAAESSVAVSEALAQQAEARLEDARSAPQKIAVAEAQLRNGDAQIAQAQANLHQAEINLAYTKIFAPQDGRITRKAVQLGDLVQKNQVIASLVAGMPWVSANFKETQLTRVRPGQPVEIKVDAYPGQSYHGHVDSVQQGTGARFSLLPPENATGNFVKVVQRVPVKIVFDGLPDGAGLLALGMSVVPTVEVAGATSNAVAIK